MESLVGHISNYKVSSVLNRDARSYGKKNLIDGSTETCWNSEQGSPQYILVEFDTPVCLSEIHIQFQGGFVGKDTELIDATKGTRVCALHPDDNNKLQRLALPGPEQSVERTRIKVLFSSSTDFYGRIVIYTLDFLGHAAA
ncbi:nuclear receptor 2C2-associated protein [Martensiomyces pterosporus]|nr:nuclear receptor 2C2-associated protein [Martensiomyces pterosporus]